MKKNLITASAVLIAVAILLSGVYFFDLRNKQNTDGFGDMGNIFYNNQEMLLRNSGIDELPNGYSLSSDTVNVDENALLISGNYEVYSSRSNDDIIYIYVDDENVSESFRGYWEFVTHDVYNNT